MMSLSKSQRAALGAVAFLALLAGCAPQGPSPVSPAVVNAPPAPPKPPFPTEDQLGTQSGTFSVLPDPQNLSQGQVGLTGQGTLVYNGRRYHFRATGVSASGFGGQVSPLNGEVFDLTAVTSFAGSYTLTALSDDKRQVVMTNEKGVKILISAMRPMKDGLTSADIRLTR
jgi:hypothetical protein